MNNIAEVTEKINSIEMLYNQLKCLLQDILPDDFHWATYMNRGYDDRKLLLTIEEVIKNYNLDDDISYVKKKAELFSELCTEYYESGMDCFERVKHGEKFNWIYHKPLSELYWRVAISRSFMYELKGLYELKFNES